VHKSAIHCFIKYSKISIKEVETDMSELTKEAFEEMLGFGDLRGQPDRKESAMCECPDPNCGSSLAYPFEWEEVKDEYDDKWWVLRRCPDCETFDEGIYTQDQVDAYDDSLDRGTERLISGVKWLTRNLMSQEVEHFAAALQQDAVLPEDIGRIYP
jgi:hypothetical protein